MARDADARDASDWWGGNVPSNTRPVEPCALVGLTNPSDLESLVTAELHSAMASARRRAARDGDRQVDTAHLLHSLLEADPLARGLFDPAQLARLLGYLVQRSIGFGLQWQSSVESSAEGDAPITASGQGPAAGEPLVGTAGSEACGVGQSRWSPRAAAALRRAASRARGRGKEGANGLDLLAALAADGGSRAAEVLRFAGIDVARTLAAPPNRSRF